MSDEEELHSYIELWWQAIENFTDVLEQVPADQWDTPTDLAGWDVHAVAAHVAHLESILAGGSHQEVEVVEAPHMRGPLGTFTEQGVIARRGRTPDDLIIEIRESTTQRRTALLADPPTDAQAAATGLFGMLGWSMRTLLRNRPLDVWMHEQDIRRAVGLPGGLTSPAGAHTVDYLSESLGLVLGKRVGAPEGTTVVVEVEGRPVRAVTVNAQGRGELLDQAPAEPDATVACDVETFALLAGGRREPEPGRVTVTGDRELAEKLMSSMAVTP